MLVVSPARRICPASGIPVNPVKEKGQEGSRRRVADGSPGPPVSCDPHRAQAMCGGTCDERTRHPCRCRAIASSDRFVAEVQRVVAAAPVLKKVLPLRDPLLRCAAVAGSPRVAALHHRRRARSARALDGFEHVSAGFTLLRAIQDRALSVVVRHTGGPQDLDSGVGRPKGRASADSAVGKARVHRIGDSDGDKFFPARGPPMVGSPPACRFERMWNIVTRPDRPQCRRGAAGYGG